MANPNTWVDPFGLAGCEITLSGNFNVKLKKHAQDIYETSRKLGVPVAKGDKEGMKDFVLSIVNDKSNLVNSNFIWNTIESTSAYVKGEAVVLVNNATSEALTFLHKGRLSSYLQEVIK
ncbi:hypothetical protein WCU98_24045 [Pectobacterium parmentieri]|nr:hypothetical protein [Pectobacterium parmentieri]